jgi:hypothetical protein
VVRSSCSPTLRQSVCHMTFVSSGRSNHVCYGPIATELVHHGKLTRWAHKRSRGGPYSSEDNTWLAKSENVTEPMRATGPEISDWSFSTAP